MIDSKGQRRRQREICSDDILSVEKLSLKVPEKETPHPLLGGLAIVTGSALNATVAQHSRLESGLLHREWYMNDALDGVMERFQVKAVIFLDILFQDQDRCMIQDSKTCTTQEEGHISQANFKQTLCFFHGAKGLRYFFEHFAELINEPYKSLLNPVIKLTITPTPRFFLTNTRLGLRHDSALRSLRVIFGSYL
ncbi:hypothetical protein NC653_026420 [Populus alba x Populus x berolinensis]|uniref:Uncharacterized protein n=1 Tax=Populus alba x Populus x berolinensis TaxID=444605 RepID=A0AAD6MEF7_9ROSI|nr:hypothetical protein NC653_026420 [Populus alba x Populus x berolinensis]